MSEIHYCHWPGCTVHVPPSSWGCKRHWFKLPMRLRKLIWKHYRPGQEITKTPSPEYIAVAKQIQEWIKQQVTPNGNSEKVQGVHKE